MTKTKLPIHQINWVDIPTLPTADEKAAMSGGSPSSGNRFLTQGDAIGGLPTGEIPNSFVNYDSDTQGVQSTNDTNWVDITDMDLQVVTYSSVPIRAQFNYTCSKSQGSATVVVAFRVILISPALQSIGMQSSFDNSDIISAVQNGGVNFRTPNLDTGIYTFRPQFRMVSGAGSVQLIRGQFFVQAQQAPKGEDGVSPGTTITWVLGVGTTATVGNNKTNIIIAPRSGVIQKVRAISKIGPTDGDLEFNIRLNNISIWNVTPADRLKITDGNTQGSQTLFDTVNIVEDDLLTIDVITNGSTIGGQDITVQLTYI